LFVLLVLWFLIRYLPAHLVPIPWWSATLQFLWISGCSFLCFLLLRRSLEDFLRPLAACSFVLFFVVTWPYTHAISIERALPLSEKIQKACGLPSTQRRPRKPMQTYCIRVHQAIEGLQRTLQQHIVPLEQEYAATLKRRWQRFEKQLAKRPATPAQVPQRLQPEWKQLALLQYHAQMLRKRRIAQQERLTQLRYQAWQMGQWIRVRQPLIGAQEREIQHLIVPFAPLKLERPSVATAQAIHLRLWNKLQRKRDFPASRPKSRVR
ncbi:MAG: hypothetical protein AAGJ35_14115, partial [Myxococcota bacterium]